MNIHIQFIFEWSIEYRKDKGPKTEFPEIKMPKVVIDNGSTVTLIHAPKENALKLLINPGETYVFENKNITYQSKIRWSIVVGP